MGIDKNLTPVGKFYQSTLKVASHVQEVQREEVALSSSSKKTPKKRTQVQAREADLTGKVSLTDKKSLLELDVVDDFVLSEEE